MSQCCFHSVIKSTALWSLTVHDHIHFDYWSISFMVGVNLIGPKNLQGSPHFFVLNQNVLVMVFHVIYRLESDIIYLNIQIYNIKYAWLQQTWGLHYVCYFKVCKSKHQSKKFNQIIYYLWCSRIKRCLAYSLIIYIIMQFYQ